MSRPGMGPRVRMRDTEMKPTEDPLTVLGRVARVLLVLIAPIAAVSAFVSLLILGRIRRVRPVIVVAVAALVVVLSFALGGFRAWFWVYRVIGEILTEYGAMGAREEIGSFLSSSWRDIILSRLPFGVPAGVFIGSCVAAARARYNAQWRKPEAEKHSAKATDRALRRAREWPQKEAHDLDALLVRMGVDQFTGRPWDLPVSAIRHHLMTVGPSGFGKTTTLIELMRGLLAAPAAAPYRIGITFVTMKPDAAITTALAALAELAGRGFHLVTQDGVKGTTYNPLRHGTASERRNVLMEAESNATNGGFSEPHYQRSGSRFTLLALRCLEHAADSGMTYSHGRKRRSWLMDLEHLARMMRLERMQEVAESGTDAALAADVADYMAEVDADKSTAGGAGGMRSRFAVIAEGAAGDVLREEPDGLDMREAIRAGDVVVFDLDAARDMEAAQYVGNLAIADWTASMADLAEEGWHGDPSAPDRMQLLLVDEFSALGGSGLRGAFARSRGQGGAVGLSTQSWGELAETSSEGFRANLLTNTSVKLLHRVEDGAEDLAGLVGTQKAMKETTQVFEDRDLWGSQTRASGQGSLREVEEFVIHPNALKKLAPGEVIAMVRNPPATAHVKIRRTPPAQLEAAARKHRAQIESSAGQQDEAEPETDEHETEQEHETTASEPSSAGAWAKAAQKASTPDKRPEKEAEPVDPPQTEDDDGMDMPIREPE